MNRSFLLAALLCSPALLDAGELSATARPVPIIVPDAQPGGDGRFVFTLDALSRRRSIIAGEQSDSVEHGFGVAFSEVAFDLVTLTYYNGADVFRQDAGMFDDGDSSRVMMTWINKMSLALKLPAAFTLGGYAQAQRGFADEQNGFTDAMKYAGELTWSPFKDITKFHMEASTQETRTLDGTILFQNVYTAAIEQKLPFVPLTLRATESWSEDRTELLSDRDKNVNKLDAALLWKIRPEVTWSTGMQDQDSVFDISRNSEAGEALFTQFEIHPAPLLGMTMRVAHENRTRSDGEKILSSDSALVLGIGLSLKMAETFDAGFGVQYRVPESQPAATPAAPNLPAFSISASAKF